MTPAPECVEARLTTVTVGRPMVDAVQIDASLVMWHSAHGRTFVVNLRLGADVVELAPHRALAEADKLQLVVDTMRRLAGDAERLAELEAATTALLDGRVRTAAV